MMISRLLVVLLCVPLLPGCEPDFCGDDVAPWVQVGKAAATFELIEEGEVLPVERGGQGAQHVWAGLRTGGLHPGSEDVAEGLANDDLPWIEFQLEGEAGLHNFNTRLRRPLDRLEGNTLFGLDQRPVQFWHWPDPPDNQRKLDLRPIEADLEAQDFVLRVIIEDACGDTVSDEIGVRLDFPPRG